MSNSGLTDESGKKRKRNNRFANLPMDRKYMNKRICQKTAEELVTTRNWDKVTAGQLSKEIYGHAFVYYKFSFMEKIPPLNKMIYCHCADGIDLTNGVDPFQPIWNVLWKLF